MTRVKYMSAVRRTLQVVAFAGTVIVGMASMVAIVTQTAWFRDRLRGFIVRQAEGYVDGRVSIGRLDGNLIYGVTLREIRLETGGKRVVDIGDVSLGYNLFVLLGGDVVIDEIRVNRPFVRLERTAEGWNVMRLVKPRTPDPDDPGSRREMEIGEIVVSDGALAFEGEPPGSPGIDVPARIDRVNTSIRVKGTEDELILSIAHASLRGIDPLLAVEALSGVIRVRENEVALENVAGRTDGSSFRVTATIGDIQGTSPVVNVTASSSRLALDEIARLVPALRGYAVQPAFEITARGPAARLSVNLDVREATLGSVRGDLTVDSTDAGRRIAGTLSFQRLDIGPLLASTEGDGTKVQAPGTKDQEPRPKLSDITGKGRIDLELPTGSRPLRGSYDITMEQVRVAGYQARHVVARGRIDGGSIQVDGALSAYGGRATAVGTVTAGEPFALDLRGRVTDLDLSNLPPSLSAPDAATRLQFDYTLIGRGPRFSGEVALGASTVAGAAILPGTTASFSIGAGAPRYAAKGGVDSLDLQRLGVDFHVAALAAERYRSRITATFDVSGNGGGRDPLTLDARGTVVESEMFGASIPRMDLVANLSEGNVRVTTVGAFANLDPALVSGDARVAGMVAGTVDAETTIRGYASGVTTDSIDVAGRVNLLSSTVGGFAIDSAEVDGAYSGREGTLNGFAVSGSGLNAKGSGHVALTDTGSTNVTLRVESAALDRVGSFIDQPIKGSAVVDALVTGNASSLVVQGTLKGSDVGHGDNMALGLSSDFTVTIPDLTPASATAKATSMAAFLQVGGQKIAELHAETMYEPSKLDFTASAEEGERQLEAVGSVRFHPEYAEIHLPTVALRSAAIEWRAPPGSDAIVKYSEARVAIEQLELVNGDQRVTAHGVLGSAEEPLRVQAENVDVAQIDRLLSRDWQVAGRLSGEVTMTGPTADPRAEGRFTLVNGRFRDYTFESLTGAVDYVGAGANVDIRLQTPTEWLTAKGYAPLRLFSSNPGSDVPQPGPGGDAVNLEIASSPIDLGLVEGFTSYVSDVTGTLQANLKVTGPGSAPLVEGAVEVRGGSFAVPELGTRYTGLDTRVDLTADRVSIREFRILDKRGSAMTVGGTLGVQARSVGAVDIRLLAEKFEVIDNRLAELRLDTDLQVTGVVRQPRIRGGVTVEAGTIHVTELLERLAVGTYAIEGSKLPDGSDTPAGGNGVPAAGASGIPTGVFDALDMDVALSVPGNLALRGNSIRAASAGVSAGDMNVTVGGAMQIVKRPSEAIRPVGEVTTVRGSYTFQGRRFDVVRDGRIGFAGTDELDPLLDLQGRRVISGIEAFVRVRGTMKKPQVSFSSNPPLDESDILALIMFNQPLNELAEDEQAALTQVAGAVASGFVSLGIAQSIGNVLRLDELQIRPQGDGGTGPSLSVSEQVGQSLFFGLHQVFGSEQTTELVLEYQIQEYLRLRATAAETSGNERVQFRRVERGGLDLAFFFSY